MHDRTVIRGQFEQDASIRGVARSGGYSRNAVRRALRPGARDSYHRHSEIDDYAEAVRDVLADYPHMAVGDIAALVDWRRSRRRLSDLVAQLRPEYVTQTPAKAVSITSIRRGALTDVGTMTLGRLDL